MNNNNLSDSLIRLISEIKEKRIISLESKIKRYPADKFRASDVSECDLAMCCSILKWQEKTLHDAGLQSIFDRGNIEEKIVIGDLTALGYTILGSQTPFEIKNKKNEVICRGHIDGKILYEDRIFPIEIKSANMNTFAALHSLEDFKKRPLHRKYLRQIQLYLYGTGQEEGLFILSDLQGHYKFIPVTIDLEEIESIISRMERLWENNIKTNVLPPPIDYDEKICAYCAFKHLCPCLTKYDGITMIDDKELESDLVRRLELKSFVEEYNTLDESIKDKFKSVGEIAVGIDWMIKVKEFQRKTYNIPTDIKDQYLEIKQYKRVDIIKL